MASSLEREQKCWWWTIDCAKSRIPSGIRKCRGDCTFYREGWSWGNSWVPQFGICMDIFPRGCITSCNCSQGEGKCCREWLTDDSCECLWLSERLLAVVVVVSNPDDMHVKDRTSGRVIMFVGGGCAQQWLCWSQPHLAKYSHSFAFLHFQLLSSFLIASLPPSLTL